MCTAHCAASYPKGAGKFLRSGLGVSAAPVGRRQVRQGRGGDPRVCGGDRGGEVQFEVDGRGGAGEDEVVPAQLLCVLRLPTKGRLEGGSEAHVKIGKVLGWFTWTPLAKGDPVGLQLATGPDDVG